MRILSGAGHARKYAPVVLACGFFNPVLAMLALGVTSGELRFVAPTIALSLLMVLVHGLALPWIVSQHLSQPLRRIVGPLFRPFLAATLTGAIAYWLLPVSIQGSSLATFKQLGLATLGYGGIYVLMAIFIATSRRERSRFLAWLQNRQHVNVDREVPVPHFAQIRKVEQRSKTAR